MLNIGRIQKWYHRLCTTGKKHLDWTSFYSQVSCEVLHLNISVVSKLNEQHQFNKLKHGLALASTVLWRVLTGHASWTPWFYMVNCVMSEGGVKHGANAASCLHICRPRSSLLITKVENLHARCLLAVISMACLSAMYSLYVMQQTDFVSTWAWCVTPKLYRIYQAKLKGTTVISLCQIHIRSFHF